MIDFKTTTREERQFEKSKRSCAVVDTYRRWAMSADQWKRSMEEHAQVRFAKKGVLRSL